MDTLKFQYKWGLNKEVVGKFCEYLITMGVLNRGGNFLIVYEKTPVLIPYDEQYILQFRDKWAFEWRLLDTTPVAWMFIWGWGLWKL